MRRVTFSFLGLGILDETEIGTIKGATVNEVPVVQDAGSNDTMISEASRAGQSMGPDDWCEEHDLEFFKRGGMRNYAHPIVNADNVTTGWCNRPKAEELAEQGSLEG